jgi:hypothetical protein
MHLGRVPAQAVGLPTMCDGDFRPAGGAGRPSRPAFTTGSVDGGRATVPPVGVGADKGAKGGHSRGSMCGLSVRRS